MLTDQAILVLGGAGYIGSHMVLSLSRAGFFPVILDQQYRPAFFTRQQLFSRFDYIQGDKGDQNLLQQLFHRYSFCAVVDFAAYIDSAESMHHPMKYYQNNVSATLNLLEVMIKNKINHYIFSSTAAVYDELNQKKNELITEKHPISPCNVYGKTKWMIEEAIRDLAENNDINYAILRYFNVAGADSSGQIGESHHPETHLIPIVLSVACKEKQSMTIFGQNYPTFDGTCIRDYIHISDLCEGHLLTLNALLAGKKNLLYNLGTGIGYSVLQVIQAVEKVTDTKISVEYGLPRKGDVAYLVADATLARKELGWLPRYTSLNTIIYHAWQFKKNSRQVFA